LIRLEPHRTPSNIPEPTVTKGCARPKSQLSARSSLANPQHSNSGPRLTTLRRRRRTPSILTTFVIFNTCSARSQLSRTSIIPVLTYNPWNSSDYRIAVV
jgi:hypothetical protein